MDSNALIKTLSSLADNHLENLKEEVFNATLSTPEVHQHFKEVSRRLLLAIHRELMDEHQTNLAFRVSVKNFIKELQEQEEEKKQVKNN